MAYQHKPSRGTIFVNDKRDPDSRQPTHRGGFALADGTQMKVSMWREETDRGEKFSIAVEPDTGSKPRQPSKADTNEF